MRFSHDTFKYLNWNSWFRLSGDDSDATYRLAMESRAKLIVESIQSACYTSSLDSQCYWTVWVACFHQTRYKHTNTRASIPMYDHGIMLNASKSSVACSLSHSIVCPGCATGTQTNRSVLSSMKSSNGVSSYATAVTTGSGTTRNSSKSTKKLPRFWAKIANTATDGDASIDRSLESSNFYRYREYRWSGRCDELIIKNNSVWQAKKRRRLICSIECSHFDRTVSSTVFMCILCVVEIIWKKAHSFPVARHCESIDKSGIFNKITNIRRLISASGRRVIQRRWLSVYKRCCRRVIFLCCFLRVAFHALNTRRQTCICTDVSSSTSESFALSIFGSVCANVCNCRQREEYSSAAVGYAYRMCWCKSATLNEQLGITTIITTKFITIESENHPVSV